MSMLLRSCRNEQQLKRVIKRRKKISRSAGFLVYILRCSDGTLYTGYTRDLKARLKLHNSGKGAKYVRGRTPAAVVYSRAYQDHRSAVREEFRIKTLTRLEKEELVRRGRVRAVKGRRLPA